MEFEFDQDILCILFLSLSHSLLYFHHFSWTLNPTYVCYYLQKPNGMHANCLVGFSPILSVRQSPRVMPFFRGRVCVCLMFTLEY